MAKEVVVRRFFAPESGIGWHRFLSPHFLGEARRQAAQGESSQCSIHIVRWYGRLSIDDFGTGYSSLSYLTGFPLSSLKIDRSFLSGVPTNAQHVGVTKAIIAMAKSLRLTVTAEGVETEEALDFLRHHGCDEAQGFLLSRPVPAEEFYELLERNRKSVDMSLAS